MIRKGTENMKQTIVLLIVAVLLALYLGSGAMAFNSPPDEISPIGATPMPASQRVDRTPCPTSTPRPTSTPQPTPIATVTLFIPISPIVFHSPITTPESVCVAVGHWGQVLCYEVP